MKRSKFSETQILSILKEGEAGALSVPDLCRKHGVGQSTYKNGSPSMVILPIFGLEKLGLI